MGLTFEAVLALRNIRRRNPELWKQLESHGIVFDDSRILSGCQPELADRIRKHLERVQRPNCLKGFRQIADILLQEMENLENTISSAIASSATPQTLAIASTPPRPLRPSTVEKNLPLDVPALDSAKTYLPKGASAAPPAPVEWQDRPPQKPWLPPDLEGTLHSLLDDFQETNEVEVCANSMPGWRVLAGTRRGRLHAHHGTFREDAFAHGGDSDQGRFWIFCVCDGAGSSRLSRVGSEVTSRRLVRELSRTFRETSSTWAALPIEGLKDVLEKTIVATVRDTTAFLGELAQRAKVEPKDFRCTLLLTVLYRQNETELACLSQVGDGFLAGLNRQGIAKRYGTADASGAFSGEVNCFIPDDGSAEKAKPFGIIPSTENLEALLLCTDGIEDPFYPVEANAELLFQQFTHETPTATPVAGIRWPEDPGGLVACADRTLACQRLARWLAFEKKGENDDRTVMLIQREPASGGAGSPKSPNA